MQNHAPRQASRARQASPNPNTTPEQFITAWQRGSSLKSVAAALAMTMKAAASRAYTYRKRGIPLKQFPRGKAPLNDKRLKELARSCQRPEMGS